MNAFSLAISSLYRFSPRSPSTVNAFCYKETCSFLSFMHTVHLFEGQYVNLFSDLSLRLCFSRVLDLYWTSICDKGISYYGRRIDYYDRRTSNVNGNSSNFDRRSSNIDRRTSIFDKRFGFYGRKTGNFDRQTGNFDRMTSSLERRTIDFDRWIGNF